MEETHFSESFTNSYTTTRCHIPEDTTDKRINIARKFPEQTENFLRIGYSCFLPKNSVLFLITLHLTQAGDATLSLLAKHEGNPGI
jgi:hypothetical protein